METHQVHFLSVRLPSGQKVGLPREQALKIGNVAQHLIFEKRWDIVYKEAERVSSWLIGTGKPDAVKRFISEADKIFEGLGSQQLAIPPES